MESGLIIYDGGQVVINRAGLARNKVEILCSNLVIRVSKQASHAVT